MDDPWILSYAIGVTVASLLILTVTYRRHGFYWASVPVIFTIYFLISESVALGQHHYQYGPLPWQVDLWQWLGHSPAPPSDACSQTSLAVPIPVVLMEGFLLFGMLRTTDLLAPPQWLRPLMDGLMAVTIDLILDPVVANSLWCGGGEGHGDGLHSGVGLWVWFTDEANPGQWFGIPLVNFAAWFFGAAAISASVRFVAARMDVVRLSLSQQFISAVGALMLCLVIGLALEAACFALMQNLFDSAEIPPIQRWLVLLGVLGAVALAVVLARDEFRRGWHFHWEVVALPTFLFAYMGWALLTAEPWQNHMALILVYVTCGFLFASYALAPYAKRVLQRRFGWGKESS